MSQADAVLRDAVSPEPQIRRIGQALYSVLPPDEQSAACDGRARVYDKIHH